MKTRDRLVVLEGNTTVAANEGELRKLPVKWELWVSGELNKQPTDVVTQWSLYFNTLWAYVTNQ